MRLVFTCLICSLSLCSFSQDLSGIWRGSFVSADNSMTDMFNLEDRYKYEVQIDQQGKKISGVTYSYKTTVFYGKASAKGTINPGTGKVVLQEMKLLELKMSESSYACWMICFMQYSKNGDEEFLEGRYSSYRETDSAACGRGKVFLRRVVTSDFYKEPFLAKHKKEKTDSATVKKIAPEPLAKTRKTTATPPRKKPLAPPPPLTVGNKPIPARPQPAPPKQKDIASARLKQEPQVDKPMPVIKMKAPVVVPMVIKNRENEVVQTITSATPEITIDIYDNGTIDHDTISVYFDNKLVVNHQMLMTKAITLKLKLDDGPESHELVMVADNLGDIPPNTSLMVVKAGDKQYEVRIASTEQKNAVVIFRYEKPR